MLTINTVVLDGVHDLSGIVYVSVYDTKPVHFLSICCNSIKWVQKNGKCMTPEQKWCTTFTFFVWMLTTHTITKWTLLTSVIHFGMCAELTTGCVSTRGGGLLYFGVMSSSLSMRTLSTKHYVNRERWSPWVIISFSVWFAWRILTPQILAAAIIWFQWFTTKA